MLRGGINAVDSTDIANANKFAEFNCFLIDGALFRARKSLVTPEDIIYIIYIIYIVYYTMCVIVSTTQKRTGPKGFAKMSTTKTEPH